jgi:hypothetical protein
VATDVLDAAPEVGGALRDARQRTRSQIDDAQPVGPDRKRRGTGRHAVGAYHDAEIARYELRAAGLDRELAVDQIGVADEVGEKARRRLFVELGAACPAARCARLPSR